MIFRLNVSRRVENKSPTLLLLLAANPVSGLAEALSAVATNT